MRVLLDECLPRKLKGELLEHSVSTVPEAGWAGKKNGALLRLAAQQFDVFITIDQNLHYQQSLPSMQLALVLLTAPNNRLETLLPLMAQVREALENLPDKAFVRIGSGAVADDDDGEI